MKHALVAEIGVRDEAARRRRTDHHHAVRGHLPDFMAERANGTKPSVRGASRAVFTSHSAAAASFIQRAARETA
ncbi:hypothetical protein [Micromonospora sp. NPDC023888]|uniref:hypothetical protein n=1 Tax=Micromonospora sp. NPDC023888 TaxID=3155607 RepID=UPI0033C61B1B